MKKLACISLIFVSAAGVAFAWDPLQQINGEYEGPLGKPLITRESSGTDFDESSDMNFMDSRSSLESDDGEKDGTSELGTFCQTGQGAFGPGPALPVGSVCNATTQTGTQQGVIVAGPSNAGTFCFTQFGVFGPGPLAALGSPCLANTPFGSQPGYVVVDPRGVAKPKE